MNVLFSLKGIVIAGHKRGKRLGFPTLNFKVSGKIAEGIYFSRVRIAGVFYNSLTFIGAAKTFSESEIFVETYVFDFSEEIYGAEVKVEILKKLRDNERFYSEDDLVKQMEEDERMAIEYFSNN